MNHQILNLGAGVPLGKRAALSAVTIPAHRLTTHCFTTGASGSGKTGATLGLVEEVLRQGIPVLLIDIKGDLSNLGLSFPTFSPKSFLPWLEPMPGDTRKPEEIAQSLASERQQGLTAAGIGERELQHFAEHVALRVITPGSDAGEALHLLSSLEQPSTPWHVDPARARASMSAGISLILRLLKRDPEPATSRDHVILSVLAERRLQATLPSDLAALIHDLLEPPIDAVGTLPIDTYISPRQRAELAAALNTLLASPAFRSWRTGVGLDIASWLTPKVITAAADGTPKTPAVVLSVAHLDDEERTLVLGIVLEELLTWVRSLPGSKALRALIVFDEVYGFLPPHPRNPATKPPLVALIKQARAFGVGLVLATQNPMDVDYRVLSNTGLWYVGRLQTDADRERVIESLTQSTGSGELTPTALTNVVKQLKNRWFVLRDVQAPHGTSLMQPRHTLSYLRGPMTAEDIGRLGLAKGALAPSS